MEKSGATPRIAYYALSLNLQNTKTKYEAETAKRWDEDDFPDLDAEVLKDVLVVHAQQFYEKILILTQKVAGRGISAREHLWLEAFFFLYAAVGYLSKDRGTAADELLDDAYHEAKTEFPAFLDMAGDDFGDLLFFRTEYYLNPAPDTIDQMFNRFFNILVRQLQEGCPVPAKEVNQHVTLNGAMLDLHGDLVDEVDPLLASIIHLVNSITSTEEDVEDLVRKPEPGPKEFADEIMALVDRLKQ